MKRVAPALLLVVSLLACGEGGVFDSDRTVRYRLTGGAPTAFVTYENGRGGSSQKTVTLPWQEDFEFKVNDVAVLVAQSRDPGSFRVTCEILVNGRQISTATSEGEFVVVTCSAVVE